MLGLSWSLPSTIQSGVLPTERCWLSRHGGSTSSSRDFPSSTTATTSRFKRMSHGWQCWLMTSTSFRLWCWATLFSSSPVRGICWHLCHKKWLAQLVWPYGLSAGQSMRSPRWTAGGWSWSKDRHSPGREFWGRTRVCTPGTSHNTPRSSMWIPMSCQFLTWMSCSSFLVTSPPLTVPVQASWTLVLMQDCWYSDRTQQTTEKSWTSGSKHPKTTASMTKCCSGIIILTPSAGSLSPMHITWEK